MTITKKEIYAKHGVNYDPKTGKIDAPHVGPIKPLLKTGDSKIGKGAYHFSTLQGNELYKLDGAETRGTCAGHCVGCYVDHSRYSFGCGFRYLFNATVLARNNLDFVERAIMAQIEADKIHIIRVHVSGDFFSRAYTEMWKRMARKNPSTVFWTYTKNADAETAFDNIPNFNVVRSVLPHIGFNFGPCAYILSAYETLKNIGENPYICRCGIDHNQHCINCKGCTSHKYVLFIEHGTDYKADTDPLFPVVKALIEAQADQTAIL